MVERLRANAACSRNCELSWVRSQHPPTQRNLRGGDEAVLNKVQKNQKKSPFNDVDDSSMKFYWSRNLINYNIIASGLRNYLSSDLKFVYCK